MNIASGGLSLNLIALLGQLLPPRLYLYLFGVYYFRLWFALESYNRAQHPVILFVE